MTDDEKKGDETGETREMRPDPPTEESIAGALFEPGGAGGGGEPPPAKPRRFLRSRDDRVIAGVSGGLGRYFDIDPVIIRIAFAVTILFGGLGVLAYLAAMIFVPADDGAGNPAPSSRGRDFGRVALIGLLVVIAFGGFGFLVAASAFVTGIGYGAGVVATIVVIGLALIVASFRGGARWLILPALALTVGVTAAAAADLELDGGVGKRDYRPASAAAIPADGYELGVGRLSVDLRDIDWTAKRVLELDLRIGAGEAIVAVPSNVCVAGEAHADGGNLLLAGQQSDGVDVESTVSEGSSATPRLVIHGDVGFGELRVLNDDGVDVVDEHFGGKFGDGRGDDSVAREANARACAG